MSVSVIVYGRNDNHGYNYHKRVSLSLNSISESLDDDDEIVFVDWNSPEGHPPLPVSIADTLTPRTQQLLQVIAVPPSIHATVIPAEVRRDIVEPYARNVGIRKAQDSSDWILSTNTDVIFVPRRGDWKAFLKNTTHSYFACPRFELPEYFWESLPRTDPLAASERIRAFSAISHLDRAIESHDYCLYDAPGDFQLVRREVAIAVGGFDESMVFGWHVDSNFAKRVWLETKSVQSMADEMSIYHCNHNRIPTQYQASGSRSNSPVVFVDRVSLGNHRNPVDDWGLINFPIEKVSLADALTSWNQALDARGGAEERDRVVSRKLSRLEPEARYAGLAVGESLPFLIDPIIAMETPPSALYLGLRQEFLAVLGDLHQQGLIREFAADSDELSRQQIDLVIVDFTPIRPVLRLEGSDEVAFDQQDAQALLGLLLAVRRMTDHLGNESSICDRTRWIFLNAEENLFGHAIAGAFHLVPSQFYSHVSPGQLKPKRSRLLRVPRRLLTNLLDLLADATRPLRSHPSAIKQDESTQRRVPALAKFLNSNGVGRLYWSVVRLRQSLEDSVRVPRSLATYGHIERDAEPTADTALSEWSSNVK